MNSGEEDAFLEKETTILGEEERPILAEIGRVFGEEGEATNSGEEDEFLEKETTNLGKEERPIPTKIGRVFGEKEMTNLGIKCQKQR